jgi:hypothetical protein
MGVEGIRLPRRCSRMVSLMTLFMNRPVSSATTLLHARRTEAPNGDSVAT